MSARSHARPSGLGIPRGMWSVILHAVVIVLGAFVVLPILYGVLSGFKDTGQLSTNPFGLPDPWVFDNYAEILTSHEFWRPLANSVFIAATTAIVVVAVSALAAYIFARFAFRGRVALGLPAREPLPWHEAPADVGPEPEPSGRADQLLARGAGALLGDRERRGQA